MAQRLAHSPPERKVIRSNRVGVKDTYIHCYGGSHFGGKLRWVGLSGLVNGGDWLSRVGSFIF